MLRLIVGSVLGQVRVEVHSLKLGLEDFDDLGRQTRSRIKRLDKDNNLGVQLGVTTVQGNGSVQAAKSQCVFFCTH